MCPLLRQPRGHFLMDRAQKADRVGARVGEGLEAV
jgi:hypothetical protein